jgi:hypothetical protein
MAIFGVKTLVFGQIVEQNSHFLIKTGIFFISRKMIYFSIFYPQKGIEMLYVRCVLIDGR